MVRDESSDGNDRNDEIEERRWDVCGEDKTLIRERREEEETERGMESGVSQRDVESDRIDPRLCYIKVLSRYDEWGRITDAGPTMCISSNACSEKQCRDTVVVLCRDETRRE